MIGWKGILLASATSALLAPAMAHAAQQSDGAAVPPAAAQEPSDDGLGEIVVYAQRRSVGESVQKVPIAVTALDPAALRSGSYTDIADVGTLAPNVQTATGGTTPNVPNFSIRGLGINGSTRTVDPSVNIIEDGMVVIFQAGALSSNTFDLESVEILRGPQGVLFGRNATGGAISLRTRRPGKTPQMLADLSYSNGNTINANVSVEGPLGSDRVLGKVAILYRNSDGLIMNTNNGTFVAAPGNPTGQPVLHKTGRIGAQDDLTIKPTLLFEIGEKSTLTLFGQYQRFNDDASSPRFRLPEAGEATVPLQTLYGFYPVDDGYNTNIDDPGYVRLRSGRVIAELVNDLGGATLTTVAAFRRISFDSTANLYGSPFLQLKFPDNIEDSEQYSIESRLNAGLWDDAVELTAGVFYLNSTTSVVEKRLQNATTAANLGRLTYIKGSFDQTTDAAAIFANVDWHATEQLTLSLGGRYSSDKKRYVGTALITCPGQSYDNCDGQIYDIAKRWDNFSPRAVVNYQITPQVLAYASYTQGFRSGNFNNRVNNPAGLTPANPETVTSYELGFKSDLFDRKVRFNAAGFISTYADLQQILNANIPGQPPVQTLINAADARITGLEMEFTVRATRALTLQANGGYTRGKFLDFTVPVGAVADPTTLNFARIPKWNYLVSADYRVNPFNLPGQLHARVSYDWRSGFFADLQNTPALYQESYGLLNGTLEYEGENWSVGLFGRNLANVVYSDQRNRSFAYNLFGGQPRTYGVRFTTKLR